MNRYRAEQLARLSELAYQPVEHVRAIMPSADVSMIDVSDTQILLVEWIDGLSVAAFRGTEFTGSAEISWTDVRTNILQGKTDWYLSTRVHGGYADAMKAAIPELGQWMYRQAKRRARVYFTGHSLGGVLATLATSVWDVEATYTFGAPRCGDRAFAKSIAGKPLYRIVFEQDVAPSYPSPAWGYRHPGERWQLRRDRSLVKGEGWRDLIHAPIAKGFLDHSVENYVEYLKPLKRGALR